MDCKEPFRLEPIRRPFNDVKSSNKRIMYSQNTYDPLVKVTNWAGNLESLPYDNCPYTKEKNNLLLSHYKRLGPETCHCYTTTTSDMLRQLELADNYVNKNPAKKITSYFSFKDTNTCKGPNMKMFPDFCAEDYISTTHKSYVLPYPYVMSPIAIPKTPFMATRIMKREEAKTSNSQFYDEDIPDVIKRLQCFKSHRPNSYNFCTGAYQDGTVPPEKRRNCAVPEYARYGCN